MKINLADNCDKSLDPTDCIHCNICKEHCLFLTKYNIDIGDMPNNEELAYNCFLCGECTNVCPLGIDGREIILRIRQKQIRENNGKLKEKGYNSLIFEKKNYKFKNYRHSARTVLFPGCNFPSFYPETTERLYAILNEKADIGMVFDCCGKPISELGLEEEEKNIIDKLNDNFKEKGIEEIIVLCPNCYYFFKGKLEIKITNIYEKLQELGIGKTINKNIDVFSPCPDRENKIWYKFIKPFVNGEINIINEAQCCGLGGCASVKEPELSKAMASISAKHKNIYNYCATCSGQMKRNGAEDVSHVLTEIIEVYESPDSKKSLINRMKTKFR